MFTPLFVSGSPKSGTTWLQKALDAHPEIACAGEGHFVELIAQPLTKMLTAYNAKLALTAERVYEGEPYYAPLSDDEIARTAARLVGQLMARRPAPEGTRYLGDKTPRYTDVLPQLRQLFPKAPMLHIVRDPRDVVASRLHHARRAKVEGATDPTSDAYAGLVRGSAQAWLQHNTHADAFAFNDGKTLHVRYEDLKADFVGQYRRIAAFLDVDRNDDLLDDIAARSTFEAMSGLKEGETGSGFYRSGKAGGWSDTLTPQAEAIVKGVCGPLMAMKGYT